MAIIRQSVGYFSLFFRSSDVNNKIMYTLLSLFENLSKLKLQNIDYFFESFLSLFQLVDN